MVKKNESSPSTDSLIRAIQIARNDQDLFTEGLLSVLRKSSEPVEQRSNQARSAGRREHPFNLRIVDEYGDYNSTHAACIETKRSATVGHRHKQKKIYEVLNPLCKISWQDTLDRYALDYWKTGNGNLECVHGDPSDLEAITGLHHIPSRTSHVFVEETPERDYHYEIEGGDGGFHGGVQRFARFGDLANFRARAALKENRSAFGAKARKSVSENIHWLFPNTHSPWYGRPEYFSAVPSIELVQCMTQREFNYYFNNGVPEFLLFVLGSQMNAKDWEKLEGVLRAGQGLKGGHMSGAFNIPSQEAEIQVEKLGLDASGGDKAAFGDKSQVTAMNIATAHQVPPLLAGILIPGRMGGTNEGPNNLVLFQAQKIAPAQKALSELLAETLGSGVRFKSAKGTATLSREDFLGPDEDKGNGFNRIIDEVDMFQLDTMSRMKTPVGEGGRDVSEGLRENGKDRMRTGGGPRSA